MPDTSPTRTIDLLEASTAFAGKSEATDPSPPLTSSLNDLFESAVDAYEKALDDCQNPDAAAWPAKYPEVAERLKEHFAFLGLLSNHRSDAANHPPTPRYELAGTRIGDYELLEIIGIGGMGEVWKAYHTKGKFLVALKMIRTGPHATAPQVEQFVKEIRTHSGLDHPHIIPINHVGEHEGQHYFTMKLAEAGTLKSRRDRFSPADKEKSRTPAMIRRVCKRLARLMAHVAEAVHHAHQYRLLHRDLKPGNILIHGPEHAYVADFGLALRIDLEGSDGSIAGTAAYMAPEQARGDKALSTAVDVYGLGAILYEMLTGRPPFQGKTVSEILQNVQHQDVISPRLLNPRVPRDMELICLKCLKKNPKERYRTAHEVAKVLNHVVDGKAVPGDPWLTKTAKLVKRKPAATVLLAVVFIVAGLGVWNGVSQWQKTVAARKNMERVAYDKLIPQAAKHLSDGDWHIAEDALELCPPELRDWEWHYLKRWSLTNRITLVGHTDKVTQVAIRPPDGNLLISGSRDGTVRLWERNVTGEFQFKGTLYESDNWVNSLAFSGDGRVLTTAGTDMIARLWDAHTLKQLKELPNAGSLVAINHDGTRLAVAGRDDRVRVWDTNALQEPPLELDFGPYPCSLAFSPDGDWLAAGGRGGDSPVRVWNLHDRNKKFGCEFNKLRANDWVSSVAFSPDGRRFGIALFNAVRMWDLELQPPKELEPQSYSGQCMCMAFRLDSAQFVTSSRDSVITVRDTENNRVAYSTVDGGQIVSVTFTPNGKRIAYARNNEVIVEQNGNDDRRSRKLFENSDTVSSFAFSDDGRELACGLPDHTVTVREVETGRQLHKLEGLKQPITSLAFSRDGRFIAVAGGDIEGKLGRGEIRIWNVQTNESFSLEGHTGPVTCVAFSPDGVHLASASHDKTVKIWDVNARMRVNEFSHPDSVRCVAFCPDGRIVTGCDDWCIYIRDVDGQRKLTVLPCDSEVLSIAISHDGAQLASGHKDETVRLWDLTKHSLRMVFQGHKSEVRSVTFRPDGRRVASASRDGTIRIWDSTPTIPEDQRYSPGRQGLSRHGSHGVAVRHELLSFRESGVGGIACVVFSPDGDLLASAGSDVKIWDGRPSTGR
jgi:WD40 repeat protein